MAAATNVSVCCSSRRRRSRSKRSEPHQKDKGRCGLWTANCPQILIFHTIRRGCSTRSRASEAALGRRPPATAPGSSRIGESTAAALGGFARPLSYRAGLQDLVGYTEACPVAERPPGPNATVGWQRNHDGHGIEHWCRNRRRLLCVGRTKKQGTTDRDRSEEHHHWSSPLADGSAERRTLDDIRETKRRRWPPRLCRSHCLQSRPASMIAWASRGGFENHSSWLPGHSIRRNSPRRSDRRGCQG